MESHPCSRFRGLTSLCDWSAKRVAFSHLQRSRTNTNRDLLAHNFPANDVTASLMINDDDDDKL